MGCEKRIIWETKSEVRKKKTFQPSSWRVVSGCSRTIAITTDEDLASIPSWVNVKSFSLTIKVMVFIVFLLDFQH